MSSQSHGEECTHHWVIDQPNGPTSRGVCKLCGEHSEFRNSMPGTGWDRNNQTKRVDAKEPADRTNT